MDDGERRERREWKGWRRRPPATTAAASPADSRYFDTFLGETIPFSYDRRPLPINLN